MELRGAAAPARQSGCAAAAGLGYNGPGIPIQGTSRADGGDRKPDVPELGGSDGRVPLLEALLNRRPRRFDRGLHLSGGQLTYRSTAPAALSAADEATLAFAGAGITGYALAELLYQEGVEPESGSGNIITHFIGRTVASGDAIHAVSLFVISDDGVGLLKRPQDFARADYAHLIEHARDHRLENLYDSQRVRLAGRRVKIPRELPFAPAFNKWSANLPRTTSFLPVNEFRPFTSTSS